MVSGASQAIAGGDGDWGVYTGKVRLNCYCYWYESFVKDIQRILCAVLKRKMDYTGKVI